MKCYTHRETEAIGVCVRCGRAICTECQHESRRRLYCPDCWEERPWGRGWGFKFSFPFHFEAPDFEGIFEDFFGATCRRCPECGKGVEASFVICPYCRARLRNVCTGCGEKLKAEWQACPFCGQAVEVDQKA